MVIKITQHIARELNFVISLWSHGI